MRHIVIWLCVLLLVGICQNTAAQDATSETTDNDGQSISPVSEEGVSNAEAEQALAEARRILGEAQYSVSIASTLLNIFQIVGLIFTAIGVFGVGNYVVALRRLEAEKNRIVSDTETQINQTRESIRQDFATRLREMNSSIEEKFREIGTDYNRKAANTTVALSLLPIGQQQYLVQDYLGAIDTYKLAYELNPDNPETSYKLGYVHVLMDELEAAERYFDLALQINPHSLPARAAKGYVHRRQAERLTDENQRRLLFIQAEQELLEALNKFPKLVDEDSQSWWGALGSLYRQRRQWDEAIAAYQKAVEVTPYSSYPLGNLARIYMKLGRFAEMEAVYQHAEKLAANKVMIDPDNYWWYTDLLYSRLVLGREEHLREEVLQGIFLTAPIESPYATKGLPKTLNSLAEGLESYKPERAAAIRDIIKRIEAHFNAQNDNLPANA